MWFDILAWAAVAIIGLAIFFWRHKRQLLARDRHIAAAFFDTVIERDAAPLLINDVQQLPFPKDQIRASLLRLLIFNANSDKAMRKGLMTGLIHLANYQRDVGNSAIDPAGVYAPHLPQTDNDWRDAFARVTKVHRDPNVGELVVRQLTEMQFTFEFFRRAEAVGTKRALREVSARWGNLG